MREVNILIENLTGHELKLSRVIKAEGKAKVSAPEVLDRACKICWLGETQGHSTGCALALEFHSQTRCFFVAARLPGPSGSWITNFTQGKPETAKFAAVVKDSSRPADLQTLLAEAPDLKKRCVKDGCEWLVVRSTEKVLDVRLRFLPVEPDRTAIPVEGRAEELPPELLKEDEEQVRHLRGFQEVLKALNQQAGELEAISAKEAMDLSRVDLPEKVKVDLVLAFLSALLERRHSCLSRLPEGVLPAEESDADSKEGTATSRVKAALDSHVQKSFVGLVKLLKFDPKREPKVCELAQSYLKGPRSRYPKLADLCSAVQQALGEAADVGWSTSCILPIGPEDVAVPLFSRLPLYSQALFPSLEKAVESLQTGERWCPEDGCLAYADDHLSVLYREGKRDKVLQKLGFSEKAMLEDQLRSMAPLPQSQAFGSTKKLPRSWLLSRELLALFLGAGAGTYDARSRAALFEMFTQFGIPSHLVASWESEIGGALFEALEVSTILEDQKASRESWRKGKVAMAAAGGGLLMAVTGGLAAPLVAPALVAGAAAVGTQAAAVGAAVGLAQAGMLVGGAITGVGIGLGAILSSLGTAGAVALFGATGAGMTGWKMSRRWGDLEEFDFQPLENDKRLVKESIELVDPKAIATLDEATQAGSLKEDVAVPLAAGGLHALRKGSELVRRQTLAGQNRSDEKLAVCYEFQHAVDQVQRSVHLALFVSGWIRDVSDFREPWLEAAKVFFPRSGHLALQWETQELRDVSAVFGQMITQELASSTASFWLKSTALSGVAAAGVAGSLAAMTVAWPVWIVSSMANLDNAWLVGVERARIGGKCLAHVLADRQTVGQRPVTLVGHSMGARLLVYCLCELYDMGELHVVDDVVLLGTPVTTEPSKWQKVRSVASGRVVNGFLGNDWVLAFLYRYLEWGVSVAGLSQVQVPGVENVNLDGLGIQGHHDYPRHIANILAKMRLGEQPRGPPVAPQASPAGSGANFL